MSKLQDAISAQGKFLSGLVVGDKVLICYDGGEIYDAGHIWRVDEKIVDLDQADRLGFNERRFSCKTGKQHGGTLVLRPFDETLYRAHLAERAALEERYEQRRQAERQATRDGAIVAILSVADMIDAENLARLSDSDLRSLMAILSKLGEPCPELI